MASLGYTLRRRLKILGRSAVPFSQRLRCVLSRHAVASPLAENFISDGGDALTARIDGFVFTLPCPGKSEDKAICHRAFTQLIAEGFIDSTLFRGNVRVDAGDVAVDVGANIGTVSAILSRRVGPRGRVVSIEPVMTEALRANIRANGLSNIEVIDGAAGDETATVEMSVAPAGIDSSIVHRNEWQSEMRSVSVRPLDDLIAERDIKKVRFIKLDVEGFEEQVIRGAAKLIARDRPAWSISAYHRDASGQPQYPALMSQLGKLGYQLTSIPYFHIYAC